MHLRSQRLLLARNDWLLGNIWCLNLDGLLGLLGGRGRELGLLLHGVGLLGRSRRASAAPKHLLDLASVVTSVLLSERGDLLGLLLGDLTDLSSLGVNDIGGILKMLVNQLLVGDVDQGKDESEQGAHNSKAPVGNELGKMVRQESSNSNLFTSLAFGSYYLRRMPCTHSQRHRNALNKEDALRLDNDKVDKLVEVANQVVDSIARHCVVATRPELCGKPAVKEKLAHNLGGHGDAERHPGQPERPAGDIEISSGEDEGQSRDEGNTRGT